MHNNEYDSPPPPFLPIAPFACVRYSALFADEDPDVDLGERFPTSRREGVSMTESGHVRLKQKKVARDRNGTGGSPGRRFGQPSERGERGDERNVWARGSRFEGQEGGEEEEEEEEQQGAGGGFGGFGRGSPPPGRTKVSHSPICHMW